jgi:nitroreductase
MEALEAIYTRRSVRKYRPEMVPKEIIENLLKAAMSAPSATNRQPWHFVVITQREKLDSIPQFHPYSNMLFQAPLAIAVCGDTLVQPDFWSQDCAAATQNILLAAHAQGLGGVWLAIYPREPRIKGLQSMLNLPEHIVPLSLISLGYPLETKSPSNRYDETKVHFNQW